MTNRKLTPEERKAICRGIKNGASIKDMMKLFDVKRTTIIMCMKMFGNCTVLTDAPRSGRPSKTSPRDRRAIKIASLKDSRLTSTEIRSEMDGRGVCYSVSSTKRVLREHGLFGRRPAKKPFISLKNRRARISFAKSHVDWTVADWSKVLFSDESKFEIFNKNVQYIRRRVGERFNVANLSPTVKHGCGNIMVWGAFSAVGVGPLKLIEGKMTKTVYRDILNDVMYPYAKENLSEDFIFQQDNDPKHTSKIVKEWFRSEKVSILEWPSQSPDLNPIENLWNELKRSCAGIRSINASAKFKLLERKWLEISQEKIVDLIVSMQNRMKAVIEAKGFPTRY